MGLGKELRGSVPGADLPQSSHVWDTRDGNPFSTSTMTSTSHGKSREKGKKNPKDDIGMISFEFAVLKPNIVIYCHASQFFSFP
jgi:hypothetical protein